ncbi:hypothetical protein [Nocardia sp. NPDC048505]|uniref:hypothetical protein n=1 Tax=unclassified Nocardia TaxID=2637762 RepID=UPI00340FF261
MPSWRDTASALAQDDLDELLEVAIRTAAEELAAEGEFYPFAAAVAGTGEVRLIAAPDSFDAQPQPTAEIRDRLLAILAATAKELRAAAVVTDVRVSATGADAIEITLEHVEGHPMRIVTPYVLRPGTSLDIDMDATSAHTSTARIWAHPSPGR